MGIWNIVKGHNDLMSEIRNTSDESIVVFKHPNEDFNTRSHLSLNPSEVALFVKTNEDGSSESLLMDKGGTLNTLNLPFFRSITKIFTGGQSMFHCAIYFVRTNVCVTNNWGTQGAIGPLQDSRGYTFKFVSNGTYDFQIIDAKVFVDNILGYGIKTVTQRDVAMKLNPKISNYVGETLSRLFECAEATLPRMQHTIRRESRGTFGPFMNVEYAKKWGVEFSDFTMNLEDVYDGLGEQYISDNREIQKKGTYDMQDQAFSSIQFYDMLKNASAKPDSGAGMIMGMGLAAGMGSRLGATIASGVMGAVQPIEQPSAPPSMGNNNTGGAFAEDQKRMERKARLMELKSYLDMGFLDKETYDARVKEIISEV